METLAPTTHTALVHDVHAWQMTYSLLYHKLSVHVDPQSRIHPLALPTSDFVSATVAFLPPVSTCGRIRACWEDGASYLASYGRLIDVHFMALVVPSISHLCIPCSLARAGPTALPMRAAGFPFVLPEGVRKKALAASLITVHTPAP